MSEIPQILSLTGKIKQSSTGVEYKFDFSLYIDSKNRNILDNGGFGKEQIEAFGLDEWFRGNGFDLEVDEIINLYSSVNNIH